MKSKYSLRAVLAIVAAFLLAGCGGSLVQRADGTWFEAVTVKAGMDRSGTSFSDYKADGVDDKGRLINPRLLKERDLAVGPTVEGQAVVAVVGGVSTAATQGIFAVKAARISADACKDGGCGKSGGDNYILNNPTAAAYSGSNANANADVKVNGALGCTTCAK